MFHDLGTVGWYPESHGCDFTFVAKGKLYGVQRKEVADLLGSAESGLLYKQVSQMNNLDAAYLIVEGEFKFNLEGTLRDKQYGQGWTRESIWGLLASAAAKGLRVVTTKSMAETRDYLLYLQKWAVKDKHHSLERRTGPTSLWGTTPNDEEYACYVLQSLPGVGPELARRIYNHFGGIPWQWSVTVDDLQHIEGIGKKKAEAMFKAIGGSDG